jgi:hypothetical protein
MNNKTKMKKKKRKRRREWRIGKKLGVSALNEKVFSW